ncbi:unnamed protein product [Cuscuta epithymum]|uniref:Uncharacterized protein n=1 Tax=Cuscuta epithymum TaxID=186058 RepID=A0AAV0CZM1_9ASTE|nr:unnamed protein product [Cuscuta epithymum]
MEFGPHSEERTTAFLALSPEVRLYSNLKKEFRDASVVSVDSTENIEDDTESATATDGVSITAVMTDYTSEARKGSYSRPVMGTSSSSGIRKALDTAELLNLMSKKKKMSPPLPPITSSAAMTTCSLPAPVSSASADLKKTTLIADFSANFCRLDNALEMKKEVTQLLLPSAVDAFAGFSDVDILAASSAFAFQVVQANLVAAKRVQFLTDELQKSKRREEEVKKTFTEVASSKLELEGRIVSQARMIESLSDRLKGKDARIASLEEYGKKKRQEVVQAAGYYTWLTRKDLMKSFLAGESSNWNPQQDIDTWDANFADEEPPVGDDDFDLGPYNAEAESAPRS